MRDPVEKPAGSRPWPCLGIVAFWLLIPAPLWAVPAPVVAWSETHYNPSPLPDDLVLPLPCGGALVFRPVATPAESPRTRLVGPFVGPAGTAQRHLLIGKHEVTVQQYGNAWEVMNDPYSSAQFPGQTGGDVLMGGGIHSADEDLRADARVEVQPYDAAGDVTTADTGFCVVLAVPVVTSGARPPVPTSTSTPSATTIRPQHPVAQEPPRSPALQGEPVAPREEPVAESLSALPRRLRLGTGRAPGSRRLLDRRPGLRRLADPPDRQALPPPERVRVGIRRPGRDPQCLSLGLRHGTRASRLLRLRQPVGQSLHRPGRQLRAQRLRPLGFRVAREP